MIRINFLATYLLCSLMSWGQSRIVYSVLQKIDHSDFYRIPITPELSSYSHIDFSDVRIFSDDGHQVPYYITSNSEVSSPAYIEFPIKSTTSDSSETTLEIKNTLRGISELYLWEENTNAERSASLSGSRDGIHWYSINDYLKLESSMEGSTDHFVQVIHFPYVTYPFFKLKISNKKVDPIHVLKAGIIQNKTAGQLIYESNPSNTINQTDSTDGNTYIRVKQDLPFLTEGLQLNIIGPPFYRRTVTLYKREKINEKIGTFELSTDNKGIIPIQAIKWKEALLVIENKDNPPLKINSINTFQIKRYLVAFLENNKEYTLSISDKLNKIPDYDLESFKGRMPQTIDTLNYGKFRLKENKELIGIHSYWLWIALFIGIAMLSFSSWKLLTEMKKNGSQQ